MSRFGLGVLLDVHAAGCVAGARGVRVLACVLHPARNG